MIKCCFVAPVLQAQIGTCKHQYFGDFEVAVVAGNDQGRIPSSSVALMSAPICTSTSTTAGAS
eukprot:m.3879 g.3879  ORF g.3879 m.3879 type:complete len:63 (+) comp4545_c0_seq1:380-568(+)